MKTKITYTVEGPYQRLKKDEYYYLYSSMDIKEEYNVNLWNGNLTVTIGVYNNHFIEIQKAIRYYE